MIYRYFPNGLQIYALFSSLQTFSRKISKILTNYPQFVQKLVVTTNYSQTFNFIGDEVDNILISIIDCLLKSCYLILRQLINPISPSDIDNNIDNNLRIFYTAAHGAYDSLCHPCLQKLRLASLLVRVSLEKLQYLHLFNRLSIVLYYNPNRFFLLWQVFTVRIADNQFAKSNRRTSL